MCVKYKDPAIIWLWLFSNIDKSVGVSACYQLVIHKLLNPKWVWYEISAQIIDQI